MVETLVPGLLTANTAMRVFRAMENCDAHLCRGGASLIDG
jgi:hypothetical protein